MATPAAGLQALVEFPGQVPGDSSVSTHYSVMPAQAVYDRLSMPHQSLLQKLDAFEAPWLEEKLLAKGTFKTQDDYALAFNEFKKYVALVAITGKKLAMMSEAVDEVWHGFILFTQQYFEFCDQFLGRYLHHVPKTSVTPLGKDHTTNLNDAYKAIFGTPPAIWNLESDCSSCGDCSGSGMCSGGGD